MLWTPMEDRLLGTKSDADIAWELQRTVSSVSCRRCRLKILVLKPDRFIIQ